MDCEAEGFLHLLRGKALYSYSDAIISHGQHNCPRVPVSGGNCSGHAAQIDGSYFFVHTGIVRRKNSN